MLNKVKFICLLAYVAIIHSGCGDSVSVLDLKSWVENPENGLTQSQVNGEYEMSIIYKPTDFMILNELRSEKIKEEDYISLKEDFSQIEYIDFKVRRSDGQGIFIGTDASFKQMYMIDLMQQDFTLFDGKDSLPCLLYHAEASGSLLPYHTILLGFEKSKSNGDLCLIFHDKIFGTGINNFTIKREAIQGVPKLKTY